MPGGDIPYQLVPESGPLQLGAVYRREHLNNRFGGSRMAGISVSRLEPVVLLFHTEEPSRQFYQDGFDDDGLYWYSGEGTRGDMRWTAANRTVRDHGDEGRDLLLLERVQRRHGLWRISHVVRYFDHKVETRPDIDGNPRRAIVFALLPIDHSANFAGSSERRLRPVEELRAALRADFERSTGTVRQRIQSVYERSALVTEYARARAEGVCEACGADAPFVTVSGLPFLEVHHIDRLADGGPDHPDRVAAVCPNCHRRCHYANDAPTFNAELRRMIAVRESTDTGT